MAYITAPEPTGCDKNIPLRFCAFISAFACNFKVKYYQHI